MRNTTALQSNYARQNTFYELIYNAALFTIACFDKVFDYFLDDFESFVTTFI